MSRGVLISLAITAAWAPLTLAQKSVATVEDFTKCAKIAGDAQRLSCYDRLAMELIELGTVMTTTSETGRSAATSSPQGITASDAATDSSASVSVATVEPRPFETVETGEGSTSKSPPIQDSADADGQESSPSNSMDTFGRERTTEHEKSSLKQIQSRYVGEFTGWDGDTVFRLENGQVWQQIESGRLSWNATNPMVTIKRGFMGSYQLSVEGVNRRVRVKRIQ